MNMTDFEERDLDDNSDVNNKTSLLHYKLKVLNTAIELRSFEIVSAPFASKF